MGSTYGPSSKNTKQIKDRSMKLKGILVRFFPERHFGFIKHEEGEIFVHEFNIGYAPINKGDRVEFEMGSFKNRPTALKVTLAATPSEGVGQ
jgi:cold shock CspA family protein